MGYSARYHVASLMAVFFALAIGILIGSQYGGDLLSSTRKDLEKSLTRDLDSARAEIKDLHAESGWADEFGTYAFPLLAHSRLAGKRIGLVGFGDLPSDVTDAVEQAIEPTDAKLVAVGAIRNPPDSESIATSITGTQISALSGRPQFLDRYGRIFGRQLITGGRILDLSLQSTLSQASGRFGRLDGMIVYRAGDQEMSDEDSALSDQINLAVLDGLTATPARIVGVEVRDTDPSGVGFFRDHSITTVDNVDMPSGKLSLDYTLNGVEGSFGVKDGATRLMPELLSPAPPPERGSRSRGEQG